MGGAEPVLGLAQQRCHGELAVVPHTRHGTQLLELLFIFIHRVMSFHAQLQAHDV